MEEQFFEEPQDFYLQEVFEDVLRKGLAPTVWIRSIATVGLSVWLVAISSSPWFHLLLMTVFLGLGIGYFFLAKTVYHAAWQIYGLIFLEACLLTMVLLYRPGEAGNLSTQAQHHAFLYYFVLLAFSTLSFSPWIIIWSASVNLFIWIVGQTIFVSKINADISANIAYSLPQEILLMLLVGSVIAAAVWQLRSLLIGQIVAERNFYEILVAERARRESEAEKNRYTDDLTNLGTRSAFERDSAQFTKVFAEGRLSDLTIAIIDLDGSHAILEQRGREELDRMLKGFAAAARRHFRSSDMAYCFSDEQFALLAPGSSMSNAERLQNLLRSIVQETRDLGFPEIDAKMGLSTLYEAQKSTEQPKDSQTESSPAETSESKSENEESSG